MTPKNKTHKILYISYDGMTDPLGQSQVLPYLVKLSERGFEFHLISFEKKERFGKHKAEIEQICKDAHIVWHPQSYTKKPPVVSTWKDLRKMNRIAFDLHHKHAFDLVHCRSYIAAHTGLRFTKKLYIPFIFDMRGFWADERIDGAIWTMKNPVYRKIYQYFKRKEKQFLEKSAAVISLTNAGKKEMLTWNFAGNKELPLEDKITVIPCSVDTNRFDTAKISAEDTNNLKVDLNIKNKNVLLYVGSIGTWYLLNEMLDFYVEYRKVYTDSVFLFLSNEPENSILEKAEARHIPQDEIKVKSVAYSEIPLHLTLATHAVFFIKPAYSKIASSPIKQGELMSMGIPVISNSGVGDTESILEKYNSGLTVKNFSPESYQESLKALQNTDFSPSQIRAGAIDYFSLEKAVSAYEQVYRECLEIKTK